jgi:hypothetical protein
MIAPIIRVHGIDFERNKFTARLASGSITLEKADKLITDAVRAEATARSALFNSLVEGSASAYRSLYMSVVMSLVATAVPVEQIPETLLLDRHRITAAQIEFNRIADRAAVLTLAGHTIVGNEASPSQQKRSALTKLAEFLVADMAVKLDGAVMMTAFGEILDSEGGLFANADERAMLFKAMGKGVEAENPVRKLM